MPLGTTNACGRLFWRGKSGDLLLLEPYSESEFQIGMYRQSQLGISLGNFASAFLGSWVEGMLKTEGRRWRDNTKFRNSFLAESWPLAFALLVYLLEWYLIDMESCGDRVVILFLRWREHFSSQTSQLNFQLHFLMVLHYFYFFSPALQLEWSNGSEVDSPERTRVRMLSSSFDSSNLESNPPPLFGQSR